MKANKKRFFSISGLFVIILIFFFISHPLLKKKINVLVIVSDALRLDVIGCYGGTARTPNIDWLAQNGTLFENAYSTAPCTVPSSVAMFTGNYSVTYAKKIIEQNKKHTQRFITHVNEKAFLLAEHLKSTGYQTIADFENPLVPENNCIQGFDQMEPMRNLSKKKIRDIESQIGIQNIGWNKNHRISSNYDRLYSTLSFLMEHSGRQPFFLVKWFFDPHSPYNPPEKFRKKIRLDPMKMSHPVEYYKALTLSQIKGLPPHEKLIYLKEMYQAEVESVDERIGFLIKALRKNNLLDNTIIVFTSDHGELFGEHGRRGHLDAYYEQLVNVPLVFMGPGIPKNYRTKSRVSHLGLMPTLRDLTGAKTNLKCQGRSYSQIFRKKSTQLLSVYFDNCNNRINQTTEGCDALIYNDMKLIGNFEKSPLKWQLFDLSTDPGEMNDLSMQKPFVLKSMFQQIRAIRKENNKWMNRHQSEVSGQEKNLDLQWQKSNETLKSLGYIE